MWHYKIVRSAANISQFFLYYLFLVYSSNISLTCLEDKQLLYNRVESDISAANGGEQDQGRDKWPGQVPYVMFMSEFVQLCCW